MKVAAILLLALVVGSVLVDDVGALSRRQRAKERRRRNRLKRRAKRQAAQREQVNTPVMPPASSGSLNAGYGVLPANLRPEIQQQLLRHRSKVCFDAGTASLLASNLQPISCRATSMFEATCTLGCAVGDAGVPLTSICRDFNGLPVHSVFDTKTCADTDMDGVLDSVENNAPNGGDGNSDGIPDRLQPNVASFPDANSSEFVTLAVPEPAAIVGVTTDPSAPTTTGFTGIGGTFAFSVTGVPVGGNVTVTATLAAANCADVTTLLKGCSGSPLVEFNSTVDTGACTVSWVLIDNDAGDCDNAANGVIVDDAAFAIIDPTTTTTTPLTTTTATTATVGNPTPAPTVG